MMNEKGTYLERFDKVDWIDGQGCTICNCGDICQEAIIALADGCNTSAEVLAYLIYVGKLSSNPSAKEVSDFLEKFEATERDA